MLVIGAKGHATEIAGVLAEQNKTDQLFFYDDLSPDIGDLLFGQFKILKSERDVKDLFQRDARFVLGIGKPAHRKLLATKFTQLGGVLTSVISPHAHIGKYDVHLQTGLNVMTGAVITQDVVIGEGTLINTHCSVHHGVRIGPYCELSPGSRVLGRAHIGSLVSIGSGAIILPDVRVGNNATIGAGAVVTRDVPDGVTVKGVPAK